MKKILKLFFCKRSSPSYFFRYWISVFSIAAVGQFGFLTEGIAMGSNLVDRKINSIPEFELQKEGRYFNGLSIHPNSNDWLFDECHFDSNPGGECSILKFDIKSSKLFRYELPAGYNYQYARYSPSGNWIVAIRNPKHINTPEATQQALDNTEIVMFHSDGTEFQVLPIPKMFMVGPVLSPSETKVAFSTPKKLNVASKTRTKSIDFDVYEYDLKTNETKLFAGPFHFVDAPTINYLNAEQLILQSYDTFEHFEKGQDRTRDKLYKLDRSKANLDVLLFNSVNSIYNPSFDSNLDLYFVAEAVNKGMWFFHARDLNILRSWKLPSIQTHFACVSPDGAYIGFSYRLGLLQHGHGIAFGLLQLSTGEWINVVIPNLNSAQLISIDPIKK